MTTTITTTTGYTSGDDPVRTLRQFVLRSAVTLAHHSPQGDPAHLFELAAGSTAAVYAFRLLDRLTEIDPEGTARFAADLLDADGLADCDDDPAAIAARLGFPADQWITEATGGAATDSTTLAGAA